MRGDKSRLLHSRRPQFDFYRMLKKETYLAAQYHRLAAKRGRKHAIMVVAHLFAATH